MVHSVATRVKTQVKLSGHKLLDTASLTQVDTHAGRSVHFWPLDSTGEGKPCRQLRPSSFTGVLHNDDTELTASREQVSGLNPTRLGGRHRFSRSCPASLDTHARICVLPPDSLGHKPLTCPLVWLLRVFLVQDSKKVKARVGSCQRGPTYLLDPHP